MKAERLYFTLRPNGTPLWITETLAKLVGIKNRERLTPEQFADPGIQKHIEINRAPKK